MEKSKDDKARLKRKRYMKTPATPEEFWKLASFISILTEEIEALPSTTSGVPANAHEFAQEIELREQVVEAVRAYLQSSWVTEDRKALWRGVLGGNQARIKSLRSLAEQNWLSLQLFSTFSKEPQLLH